MADGRLVPSHRLVQGERRGERHAAGVHHVPDDADAEPHRDAGEKISALGRALRRREKCKNGRQQRKCR